MKPFAEVTWDDFCELVKDAPVDVRSALNNAPPCECELPDADQFLVGQAMLIAILRREGMLRDASYQDDLEKLRIIVNGGIEKEPWQE